MTPAVLCAGRLYCDLVFTGAPRLPTPGTEVFAEGLTLHAGGGAFITAATFAALGHGAGLAAIWPAAPFDTIVAGQVTALRVSADLCQTAQAGTEPQITVAIAANGDRAFLTRADGPAVPVLRPGDLKSYRHLHIGELRTLQDHPGLLTLARSAGLTVSLDCGWQDDFGADVGALIAAVDVFLPNAREAAALSALGIAEDCAPLTVVKRGERGARARVRGSADWIDGPTRPSRVVDATGAGDAFNGGFVSEWLRGAPVDMCLASGNACGATAVGALGGAGGLSRLSSPLNRVEG